MVLARCTILAKSRVWYWTLLCTLPNFGGLFTTTIFCPGPTRRDSTISKPHAPTTGSWILWGRVSASGNRVHDCPIITHTDVAGKLLQVSIDQLIIEQGMDKQPFAVEYDHCQKWVTHLWLKSLWEKLYLFGIKMQLRRLQLRPPRDRYEESMDRGAPEGDYCTVERRLGGRLKILARTQPEENPPGRDYPYGGISTVGVHLDLGRSTMAR